MCVTVQPETQSKWGNPRAAKIVYYTERSCRKSWNEMSWWNFTTIPIWTTRTAISRTRHARSIPSHRWRSLVGCNVKVYQQQTHSIGTSVGASPSIAPTSNSATNELSPTQPSWCRQTSALVYGSAGRKKFNLLHTGGLIVYLLVIKIDMYSCDVLNQYWWLHDCSSNWKVLILQSCWKRSKWRIVERTGCFIEALEKRNQTQ